MTRFLYGSTRFITFDEVDQTKIDRLERIWTDGIRDSGVRCSINSNRRNNTTLGRYLLDVTDPLIEVDHKDRDICNFRRENLRFATRQQQNMNQGLRFDNTSGYKGVNFHKAQKCFVARIQINGKRKTLGYFNSPELAAKAYDKAAIKHFKEFAVLNFPNE